MTRSDPPSGSRRQPRSVVPVACQVESLTHDGRGVAKIGGKTTFIDGALGKERVQFVYTARRRDFDEGRVVSVEAASPDRCQPFCPSFGVCGGCSLQHLTPLAQIAAKEQALVEALTRIGQVTPLRVLPPLLGPTRGYRRKARLGVRYVHKKGRVLVGFREKQGRLLADLTHCPVLAAPVDQLLSPLAELIGRLAARERIPQIEVAVGDETTTLGFRHLEPLVATDLAALQEFAVDQSVQIALQPAGPDTLQPLWPENQALWLTHPSSQVRIDFLATDFVQVNAAINRDMVEQAIALLKPSSTDRVLDLFCGLGNFGLPLARHVGEVLGVEGDAAMVSRAQTNARRSGIDHARFVVADLSQDTVRADWMQSPFDIALLDPPRIGAEGVIASLAYQRPAKILYVSCHPGTLARDTHQLVHAMGYRLACVGVMDMFPHTSHVESMALFLRD